LAELALLCEVDKTRYLAIYNTLLARLDLADTQTKQLINYGIDRLTQMENN
jgi:hypothetical protein